MFFLNVRMADRTNHAPFPPTRDFEFPFTPYPVQLELMNEIFSCLESGGVGIFESPTGTGKSLSVICSALKWRAEAEESRKSAMRVCVLYIMFRGNIIPTLYLLRRPLLRQRCRVQSHQREVWINLSWNHYNFLGFKQHFFQMPPAVSRTG